MAGLTLEELKFRGIIERTLAITPANFTDQWRRHYWLYTVVNCKTKPALYVIQERASKLSPKEEVSVVRYVVGFGERLRVAARRQGG